MASSSIIPAWIEVSHCAGSLPGIRYAIAEEITAVLHRQWGRRIGPMFFTGYLQQRADLNISQQRNFMLVHNPDKPGEEVLHNLLYCASVVKWADQNKGVF